MIEDVATMTDILLNAVIASILSAILFGILGSLVSVRRIASLAGAISHAVLGGIGMAVFFSVSGRIPFFSPLAGAFLFAILSALIIFFVSTKSKQREDTVINAVWAIGMSIGVLFMAKTPGYTDPSSYLFGNILLITKMDLLLLAILDLIVLFLAWLFYPQILSASFDESFARVRGVKTELVFFVLLIIIAISVVLLQTFVGLVMVIAMLTLPSGTASYMAKSLSSMMVFASVFSLLFSLSGLALSWTLDLPSGAVTVVFAGFVFLLFTLFHFISKKRRT